MRCFSATHIFLLCYVKNFLYYYTSYFASFFDICGFTTKSTRRRPITATTVAVQNTDFTPLWIKTGFVGSDAVLALYATAYTAAAIVPASEYLPEPTCPVQ